MCGKIVLFRFNALLGMGVVSEIPKLPHCRSFCNVLVFEPFMLETAFHTIPNMFFKISSVFAIHVVAITQIALIFGGHSIIDVSTFLEITGV